MSSRKSHRGFNCCKLSRMVYWVSFAAKRLLIIICLLISFAIILRWWRNHRITINAHGFFVNMQKYAQKLLFHAFVSYTRNRWEISFPASCLSLHLLWRDMSVNYKIFRFFVQIFFFLFTGQTMFLFCKKLSIFPNADHSALKKLNDGQRTTSEFGIKGCS